MKVLQSVFLLLSFLMSFSAMSQGDSLIKDIEDGGAIFNFKKGYKVEVSKNKTSAILFNTGHMNKGHFAQKVTCILRTNNEDLGIVRTFSSKKDKGRDLVVTGTQMSSVKSFRQNGRSGAKFTSTYEVDHSHFISIECEHRYYGLNRDHIKHLPKSAKVSSMNRYFNRAGINLKIDKSKMKKKEVNLNINKNNVFDSLEREAKPRDFTPFEEDAQKKQQSMI